jgi:hypothetical protein
MPALDPYTDSTFKEYLHRALGHTATGLHWSVAGGHYDELLLDTKLALDVNDLASLTSNADLKKLRVVGRVQLWRAVLAATAGDYAFSADGGSYSREQVHAHAQAMLAQAESEAMAVGALEGYVVSNGKASYPGDPYADYDDELASWIDQL